MVHVPATLDAKIDLRIDIWAETRIVSVGNEDFEREQEACRRRDERVVRRSSYLSDTERLLRAYLFYSTDLERLGETEMNRVVRLSNNITRLCSELRKRPLVKRRGQPGRPSQNRGLIELIVAVRERSGWSGRRAAGYIARRVAAVWARADGEMCELTALKKFLGREGSMPLTAASDLSKDEINALWGGWWATDEKQKATRETRLAEKFRIAYVDSVRNSART